MEGHRCWGQEAIVPKCWSCWGEAHAVWVIRERRAQSRTSAARRGRERRQRRRAWGSPIKGSGRHWCRSPRSTSRYILVLASRERSHGWDHCWVHQDKPWRDHFGSVRGGRPGGRGETRGWPRKTRGQKERRSGGWVGAGGGTGQGRPSRRFSPFTLLSCKWGPFALASRTEEGGVFCFFFPGGGVVMEGQRRIKGGGSCQGKRDGSGRTGTHLNGRHLLG